MKRDQNVKVTLEVAQDAEEFIRKLIRDEIEMYMQKQTRLYRAQTPHLAHEIKALGEDWER